MRLLSKWFARILLSLIKLYRVCVSPFLRPCCRFHPSCSTYAQTALKRFGVCHGLWLTMGRLFRCHPFHPGGLDPVPEKKK